MNVNPNETLPKPIAASNRALQIDDRLPEAHVARAWILGQQWDLKGALLENGRALPLSPSLSYAGVQQAELLTFLGKFQEARTELQKARETDPLLNAGGNLIQLHFFWREYEETIRLTREFPLAVNARYYHARSLAELGRLPESIGELENVRKASSLGRGTGVLSGIYTRSGRRADALKLRDEVLKLSKSIYMMPTSMAQLYLGLGDKKEAFRWLEKGCREHDPTMLTLKVEICWDSLRSDPRFEDLLRRVGLAD